MAKHVHDWVAQTNGVSLDIEECVECEATRKALPLTKKAVTKGAITQIAILMDYIETVDREGYYHSDEIARADHFLKRLEALAK